MKINFIGLIAIAFMLSVSALTVSAQLEDLPKMPHKKVEPGALPDLMIASAAFHDSTVDVDIRNAGKAPSQPTGAVLHVYATTDAKSKIILTLTGTIPSLPPG